MVRRKYLIKRPVVYSVEFHKDLFNIATYTLLKFGSKSSVDLKQRVYSATDNLSTRYLSHSECRFLETKSKMYRTIPIKRFASVLYRIKPTRIEVLSMYPNARATATFVRNLRRIKI